MKRDFLALNQFSRDELDNILALTAELKLHQKRGVEHALLCRPDFREIVDPHPDLL